MSGSSTLLDLAGGVGLLLWGTHMVTSGLMRGFGVTLRRSLGRGLRHRSSAFAGGLLVTALLQSSTATALMVSSFAAGGLFDLTAARRCCPVIAPRSGNHPRRGQLPQD